MNQKTIMFIVVGIMLLMLALCLFNNVHNFESLIVFIVVGVAAVICLFIGGLQLLALGVSKGVKKTAIAMGADENTASEIGAVAGGIAARVAGIVVAADVIGNISDSLGNAAPNIDTSSVVTPTPDVGIDTSTLFGSPDGLLMTSTAVPDVSSVTNGIAVGTNNTVDLCGFDSMEANAPLQQFEPDMGTSNSATTIYDTNGFEQASIIPMDSNSSVIQGSDGLGLGSIGFNEVTGSINMYDAFGFQYGSVNDSGNILGIDGFSDGRIVSFENGNMVIQDSMQHTIGHILGNGICTDELGMPLGIIKN